MLFDRALPARFHAFYQGEEAVVQIFPLRIISGSLPGTATDRVLAWAVARRAELLADWQRCRLAQRPLPIAPPA
jgi:hypothetical protein